MKRFPLGLVALALCLLAVVPAQAGGFRRGLFPVGAGFAGVVGPHHHHRPLVGAGLFGRGLFNRNVYVQRNVFGAPIAPDTTGASFGAYGYQQQAFQAPLIQQAPVQSFSAYQSYQQQSAGFAPQLAPGPVDACVPPGPGVPASGLFGRGY